MKLCCISIKFVLRPPLLQKEGKLILTFPVVKLSATLHSQLLPALLRRSGYAKANLATILTLVKKVDQNG